MARVEGIIARVRDTLSDSDEERYKTDRLLRALSECQSKIAKDSLCVRYKCTVELCDGHHTYKLDSAAVETIGGTPIALFGARNHAGKPIRFVTEEYMDRKYPDWATATGTDVTHIVYDNQQPHIFRVYPIPDDTDLGTGESFNTTENPITDSATIVQPIGTSSNFDITTEIAPIKILLDFYLNPPAVTLIDDTNLLVPDHFDEAIKHYIAGIVLRDDKDSQNRQFGKEELELFSMTYEVADNMANKDFVDQKSETYVATKYNAELV